MRILLSSEVAPREKQGYLIDAGLKMGGYQFRELVLHMPCHVHHQHHCKVPPVKTGAGAFAGQEPVWTLAWRVYRSFCPVARFARKKMQQCLVLNPGQSGCHVSILKELMLWQIYGTSTEQQQWHVIQEKILLHRCPARAEELMAVCLGVPREVMLDKLVWRSRVVIGGMRRASRQAIYLDS